jgi:hypothetical protein
MSAVGAGKNDWLPGNKQLAVELTSTPMPWYFLGDACFA